jgi:hypothetical protein
MNQPIDDPEMLLRELAIAMTRPRKHKKKKGKGKKKHPPEKFMWDTPYGQAKIKVAGRLTNSRCENRNLRIVDHNQTISSIGRS